VSSTLGIIKRAGFARPYSGRCGIWTKEWVI
jgi:hypothetical protein